MKKHRELALILALILALGFCLSACGNGGGNWAYPSPVIPAMPELNRDGFFAAAESLGMGRGDDQSSMYAWVDEQGVEHLCDEAVFFFSSYDSDYEGEFHYFDCADADHAQHLYEGYYNDLLDGGFAPRDLSGPDYRAFWVYGDEICAFGMVVQKDDRLIVSESEKPDVLRTALDGAGWSALALTGLEEYQFRVSERDFENAASRFGYELEGQYSYEPLPFPDGDHDVAEALNFERWNGHSYYCRWIRQSGTQEARDLFDAEYDYYFMRHRSAFNAVQEGANYQFFWSEDDVGVVLQVEDLVVYVTGESRDQVIQIMNAMGYDTIYW